MTISAASVYRIEVEGIGQMRATHLMGATDDDLGWWDGNRMHGKQVAEVLAEDETSLSFRGDDGRRYDVELVDERVEPRAD